MVCFQDRHNSSEVNSATRADAVRVGDTTRGSQKRSIASIIAGGDIDTQSNPSIDTILKSITEESILEEGVRGTVLSLILDDMVIGIGGDGDFIRVVRVGSLDLVNKILVEEELTDVSDVTAGDGVVLQLGSTDVGNDVDVGGSAAVVTGEHGLELSDTLGIGLLDTTEEGLVEVGVVIAVTIARVLDTGVNTGGVAVPHVPVEILDRLTGLDVNELAVHDDRDTGFAVADVRPDQFTLHPERSDFSFRGKNTHGVLGEQLFLGGLRGHIKGRVVRGVHGGVVIASINAALAVHLVCGRTASLDPVVDSTALQMAAALAEGTLCIVEEASLRGVRH